MHFLYDNHWTWFLVHGPSTSWLNFSHWFKINSICGIGINHSNLKLNKTKRQLMLWYNWCCAFSLQLIGSLYWIWYLDPLIRRPHTFLDPMLKLWNIPGKQRSIQLRPQLPMPFHDPIRVFYQEHLVFSVNAIKREYKLNHISLPYVAAPG